MANQSSVLNCAQCSSAFKVLPQEKEFYLKKDLPDPKNCPTCRREKRLSLKNPRNFHKTACQKCQKDVITTYDLSKQVIIYCQDCFWNTIG